MLHPELERRFEALLAAWRSYHAVRVDPPTLIELAEARFTLDQARDQMHALRSRLAPEPEELAIADGAAVCPHLETPSFVTHGLCGCGTRVAALPAVS
jgi:hypothetical protein